MIRRGTIREKRFLSAFKSPNPFVLLHSTEVWGCFFFRLKVLELRVSRRDVLVLRKLFMNVGAAFSHLF